MFEHNILASVLALISKICALILCYVSHRKCLPLMVLQFFTAICYFLLSSVDFDPKDSSNCGIGITFVVHMSTFLITASFGLVWVITPETFPKKYRYLYFKEYKTEPKSKIHIKWRRFLKVALICSHHLHLHWKFKLWAGSLLEGWRQNIAGCCKQTFENKKFEDNTWQCFAFTPHLKENLFWIFTEGDGIECRLSS